MAESYLFIESGIILNTRSTEDFHNCAARIGPSDFVVCRDVFQFMVEYVEQYDRLPPKNLLYENYPDILDTNAIGADLDYCVRAFEKQRLSRQAIGLYQDNRDLMISDPENAISNVLSGLERLNLNADKSLLIYNDGSRKRLEQFHERRNVRNNSRFKIIGIPTPLRSINRTGVGLLPGELCGLFARPGTGKSWFVIKAAAICAHLGYKTLFVSPEMPDEQMSLRLDVMLGRLKGYEFSHSALKTGGDIDEASYAEFLEKCDERSLFVCDNIEGRSVTLAGIARLVRKHRPDVLIVDNMEILSPGEAATQLWEKMNNLYYGLKGLCTSTKVAAFVTHQANREASNVFQPPKINEVASGDALARAADIALSMCRVEDDDKKRLIAFQKFRDVDASTGKSYVIVDFDVDRGVFEEPREIGNGNHSD